MDREKRKQLLLDIVDVMEEAARLYSSLLSDEADLDETVDEILALESEGDMIQNELDKYYKHQKNIPYLSLDRAKLLSKIDDILDDIAIAARTYAAYASVVPNSFYEKNSELAKKIREMSSTFAKSVRVIYTSFQESLELIEELETLRDDAMDFSFDLEKSVFEETSEDNWKKFTAERNIITKTMKVIGEIKDASEILEIMAMKYE